MAEKRCKVSVLVATYNHAKYIAHTIESIVSQKVDFDMEVIIGDDSSTDGTADIVNEYASKNPELITAVVRQKNLGMTGNLTDIMMRAKGEYIALIEGDDYWIDENKLKKQVEFMDSHADYSACFGLCQIVDENEVRHPEWESGIRFLDHEGDYTIRDFEKYILPGQTATSMYRTSCFVAIQKKLMAEGMDISQFVDMHLVLLILSTGKIYNIGETVSAYRYVMTKGSGSWSSENDYYSLKNLMNYLDTIKGMESLAKLLGLELDFDSRRLYEWDKLKKNISMFSKQDAKMIEQKLMDDCNDKWILRKHKLKRRIKSFFRNSIR